MAPQQTESGVCDPETDKQESGLSAHSHQGTQPPRRTARASLQDWGPGCGGSRAGLMIRVNEAHRETHTHHPEYRQASALTGQGLRTVQAFHLLN